MDTIQGDVFSFEHLTAKHETALEWSASLKHVPLGNIITSVHASLYVHGEIPSMTSTWHQRLLQNHLRLVVTPPGRPSFTLMGHQLGDRDGAPCEITVGSSAGDIRFMLKFPPHERLSISVRAHLLYGVN